MKNATLLLALLFVSTMSFGQIKYPTFTKKTSSDVHICSVELKDDQTLVTFKYKNTKESGHHIWLHAPATKNAMRIDVEGKSYRLLSVDGISTDEGVTFVAPGKEIYFSAKFAKIPSETTQMNIIEGETGNWDFFGVNIEGFAATKE